MRKIKAVVSLALAAMVLNGCAAVALTAVGVGMATGVSHHLNGMVYKTFSTSQGNVKRAAYGAMNRMQIKVTQSKREGSNETILAKAGDREIVIELEALTPATTRMKVQARQNGGMLTDGATATEVILQTERFVGNT
jgi:PBP1b-binding outer membrane lipoprotein LpoB